MIFATDRQTDRQTDRKLFTGKLYTRGESCMKSSLSRLISLLMVVVFLCQNTVPALASNKLDSYKLAPNSSANNTTFQGEFGDLYERATRGRNDPGSNLPNSGSISEAIGKDIEYRVDEHNAFITISKNDRVLAENIVLIPVDNIGEIMDDLKKTAKELTVHNEYGEDFLSFISGLVFYAFEGTSESRAEGAFAYANGNIVYFDTAMWDENKPEILYLTMIHEAIHLYLLKQNLSADDLKALIREKIFDEKVRDKILLKSGDDPVLLRHYYARYYLQNGTSSDRWGLMSRRYEHRDNNALTDHIRYNMLSNLLNVEVERLRRLAHDSDAIAKIVKFVTDMQACFEGYDETQRKVINEKIGNIIKSENATYLNVYGIVHSLQEVVSAVRRTNVDYNGMIKILDIVNSWMAHRGVQSILVSVVSIIEMMAEKECTFEQIDTYCIQLVNCIVTNERIKSSAVNLLGNIRKGLQSFSRINGVTSNDIADYLSKVKRWIENENRSSGAGWLETVNNIVFHYVYGHDSDIASIRHSLDMIDNWLNSVKVENYALDGILGDVSNMQLYLATGDRDNSVQHSYEMLKIIDGWIMDTKKRTLEKDNIRIVIEQSKDLIETIQRRRGKPVDMIEFFKNIDILLREDKFEDINVRDVLENLKDTIDRVGWTINIADMTESFDVILSWAIQDVRIDNQNLAGILSCIKMRAADLRKVINFTEGQQKFTKDNIAVVFIKMNEFMATMTSLQISEENIESLLSIVSSYINKVTKGDEIDSILSSVNKIMHSLSRINKDENIFEGICNMLTFIHQLVNSDKVNGDNIKDLFTEFESVTKMAAEMRDKAMAKSRINMFLEVIGQWTNKTNVNPTNIVLVVGRLKDIDRLFVDQTNSINNMSGCLAKLDDLLNNIRAEEVEGVLAEVYSLVHEAFLKRQDVGKIKSCLSIINSLLSQGAISGKSDIADMFKQVKELIVLLLDGECDMQNVIDCLTVLVRTGCLDDGKNDINSLFSQVNKENYMLEPYSACLYLKIREGLKEHVRGLSYLEFIGVITGDMKYTRSKYKTAIMMYIQKNIIGDKLSDEERQIIIHLSVRLNRAVMEFAKRKYNGDPKYVVTFRELMRFSIDLSRQISKAKRQKEGVAKIFEYFVVTSGNIYGFLFSSDEAKAEFIGIMQACFSEKYMDDLKNILRIQEDFDSRSLYRMVSPVLSNGTYNNTNPQLDDSLDEPTHSAKVHVLRAVETKRPLLLLTGDDSHVAVEDAVMEVKKPNDTVAFLPMSRFTKRNQLFGQYMPVTTGQGSRKEWRDGVLVSMAKEASANPNREYYAVFENIEAMPENVRVLFNPILWENTINVPEIGIVAIPSNMHLIFTMHRDAEIRDASFMDRPLRQYVRNYNERDVTRYLENRVKIDYRTASDLARLWETFNSFKWEEDFGFSVNDIVEIAKRIKGISSDKNQPCSEIWRREAYAYLFLRAKNDKDRKFIASTLKINDLQQDIHIINDKIYFDGVGLDMSEELKSYSRANPQLSAEQILFDVYGFIVTDTEIALLSQMARALKYGGKVIQIEGPSGEGKTEISKVFSRMISFELQDYTIGEKTGIKAFRGYIGRAQDGGHRLYEDNRYLRGLREGGRVFLFNEINGNMDGGLYFWLYPESAGLEEKVLFEYPLTEGGVNVSKINRNSLWVYAVNPHSGMYSMRGTMPQRVSATVPCFTMAMKESSVPAIAAKMFEEKHSDYAELLTNIFLKFKKAQKELCFMSNQDITRRELKRAASAFYTYIQQGNSEQQAFSKAIEDNFVYTWQNTGDVQTALNTVIGEFREFQPTEDKLSILKRKLALKDPVMIFSNSAISDEEIVQSIAEAEINPVVHHIPLSYFHKERQLLGGFIPGASGDTLKYRQGLGIILRLILEARFDPKSTHIAVLHNYLHLDPQTAPLFNEFFQTGSLAGIAEHIITDDLIEELMGWDEVKTNWCQLRGEYIEQTGNQTSESMDMLDSTSKKQFIKWLVLYQPSNLRIRALASAGEASKISPAELDRFNSINIAEDIDEDWITDYVSDLIDGKYTELTPYKDKIMQNIMEVFGAYNDQMDDMYYEHVRMGRKDIDALLVQIRHYEKELKELNEGVIDHLCYIILGSGLMPYKRDALSFNPFDSSIDYEQIDGRVYLNIGRYRYRTRYINVEKQSDGSYLFTKEDGTTELKRFLVETSTLKLTEEAILAGMSNNMPIILEGHPGGGKTTMVEDLAGRLGLKLYTSFMYEDIDLTEFLGGMAKIGTDITLTCDEKDIEGNPIIAFLKAYMQGGIYLLDEGAVGVMAKEVISFIVELSQLEEFDLGTYHPYLKGKVLKKSDDFHLVITQNPSASTKSREYIPYKVDTLSQKIWIDNKLKESDALDIVDYYLDSVKDRVSDRLKVNITGLHNDLLNLDFAKSNITQIDPVQLSPRQLINVVTILRDALNNDEEIESALFKGIMTSYFTGITLEEEFNALWNMVRQRFGNTLDKYLPLWSSEIIVEEKDLSVNLGGIKIPRGVKGNSSYIPEESEIVYSCARGKNSEIRALATALGRGKFAALLEEDGADAIDLVKRFCFLTGWELHMLDSHPQMKRSHLLNSLLPHFSDTDVEGVKKEQADMGYRMALGFISSFMVTREEMESISADSQPHKILLLNQFDAIPEKQRVLLNDFLNTRRITLHDENGRPIEYVLPEWIHIVVTSSMTHNFSSPFINRFTKVGVKSVKDFASVKKIINQRYPSVTDEEIMGILYMVSEVYANDRDRAFAHYYGFSFKDIMHIAREIQIQKQTDSHSGKCNTHPLYYFIREAGMFYLNAVDKEDQKKILDILRKSAKDVSSHLKREENIDTIVDNFLSGAKNEAALIEKNTRIVDIEYEQISEELSVLDNGIGVWKNGNVIIVQTDSGVYVLDEQKQNKLNDENGLLLSEDLTVRKRNGKLIFTVSIISKLGGTNIPRGDFNTRQAIPASEAPTGTYIKYIEEINRLGSAMLRAWRRVEDGLGYVVNPRVVMVNGETGTAKTTFVRNISRIWGVPLYTLNSYAEMKVGDVTAELRLRQGMIEVGVKEFLARCGKINGQRIHTKGGEDSNRKILLIDEANANADILCALQPLFRGEKKFTVCTAGEKYEVELDSEVMVVLTFNPEETYSGRSAISKTNRFDATKLWAPNPADYTDEKLISIVTPVYNKALDDVDIGLRKPVVKGEGYQEVEPYKVVVEDVSVAVEKFTKADFAMTSGEDDYECDREMIKGRDVIDWDKGPDAELEDRQMRKIDHVFDPELVLHKRYTVRDMLSGVAIRRRVTDLTERKVELQPSGYTSFTGRINLDVDGNWKKIPTPGASSILTGWKADGIELSFAMDAQDQLYVRSRDGTEKNIDLEYTVAVPLSYYRYSIKNNIPFTYTEPQNSDIKDAINIIGLDQVDTSDFNAVLLKLVKYFRDFRNVEDGIQGSDSNYLDIVRSKSGVCRHRAYAFAVTAIGIGMQVRYISNNVHAYCEVNVPNMGWILIDLGGGGDPLSMDDSEVKGDVFDIPDNLPKPKNYVETGEEFSRRKQQVEEARHKNGTGMDSKEGEKAESGNVDAENVDSQVADNQQKVNEGVVSELAKLMEISPNIVRKFLEIYASDPQVVDIYDDTGDEIDIERDIAGDMDPFYTKKTVKTNARIASGVTVDISGSVRDSGLAPVFLEMARLYVSLFYYAGILNRDVEFSLGALGWKLTELLSFDQCRDRVLTEAGLKALSAKMATEGTKIYDTIEGVIKKYHGKRQENKLEIVITDGDDYHSGKTPAQTNALLREAERNGIDIIIIGVNSPAVANYNKFVLLDHKPTARELINLIMMISIEKAKRGILPRGSLGKLIGVRDGNADFPSTVSRRYSSGGNLTPSQSV